METKEYYNILSDKYRNLEILGIEELDNIYKKYAFKKFESIADLIISVLSLNLFSKIEEEDPLIREALNMTNPNFDSSLNYSETELMGITNSTKGKYFELLVANRLNNGEQVGDILLKDNQFAILAESLNQPEWDLKIVNESGETIEYLQLKVTDQLNYISETLERYPDIKIITTEEITDQLENDFILASGMSNTEITAAVSNGIGPDVDYFDEFSMHFNPLITIGFIVATQGFKLAVNNVVLDDKFLEYTESRIKTSLIATLGGALTYPIGGGIISGMLTVGLGAYLEEKNKYKSMKIYMDSITQELVDFSYFKQV